MNIPVYVQDIPRKIAALFEAVEALESAWFDYCQSEPNTEVPKDFFLKIIAVCETYEALRTGH